MGRNSSGNRGGDTKPRSLIQNGSLQDHQQVIGLIKKATGTDYSQVEEVSMATVNPDLYGDIMGTWNQTKALMGDPKCDLFVGDTDDALAVTVYDPNAGRSMIILDKKTFNGSRADLQKIRNEQTKSGWKQSDYLMATVVHEMGHAYVNKVGYEHGDNARTALLKQLDKERTQWGRADSRVKKSYAYNGDNSPKKGNEYNSEMLTRNFHFTDRLNSPTRYSVRELNILNDFLDNGKKTKRRY